MQKSKNLLCIDEELDLQGKGWGTKMHWNCWRDYETSGLLKYEMVKVFKTHVWTYLYFLPNLSENNELDLVQSFTCNHSLCNQDNGPDHIYSHI